MSGTDEPSQSQGGTFLWGLRPQAPGIYRIDAIPVNQLRGWGSVFAEPQPGLGPGVGAQLASQHWLILRSGRLQCIHNADQMQRLNKKHLTFAALSDMPDIRAACQVVDRVLV